MVISEKQKDFGYLHMKPKATCFHVTPLLDLLVVWLTTDKSIGDTTGST